MFRLGIVGRAGAGKSTVADALAETGAEVIRADALGHEVTDRDPEVRAALIREYGADVYRPDGALDRRRVAARVFADEAARARLDALVHPRILARIAQRIDALRAAGFRGVVVLDAALMLDWQLEQQCDAVLAVVAREEDQIMRLRQQRGWSEAEARARLAVQRPDEAFRAAADVTIENLGDAAHVAEAARAAVAALLLRHGGDFGAAGRC